MNLLLDRLVSIKKRRGLTQQNIADKLGVANTTISKYEKGEISLSTYVLEELSKILKVSPLYLMDINYPFSCVLSYKRT